MKVTAAMVVSLDFSLALEDGTVVDRSHDGRWNYLHGDGQIVPGLERALEGLTVGAQTKVVVPPADAYGEHDPRGVVQVPLEQFGHEAQPEAGITFFARDGDAEPSPVTVLSVHSDHVLVDFNHPLAGRTLTFDVRIRGVRPATEAELKHGHAHPEP